MDLKEIKLAPCQSQGQAGLQEGMRRSLRSLRGNLGQRDFTGRAHCQPKSCLLAASLSKCFVKMAGKEKTKTARRALLLPSQLGRLGSALGSCILRSPTYVNEAPLTADSQSLANILQSFLLHAGILSCGTSLCPAFSLLLCIRICPFSVVSRSLSAPVQTDIAASGILYYHHCYFCLRICPGESVM